MAAERVVKTEDGEKLAKVMRDIFKWLCSPQQRSLYSSNVFSISGIWSTIHGDQCQDRSQCGPGFSSYRKVSFKPPVINTYVYTMDEITLCNGN